MKTRWVVLSSVLCFLALLMTIGCDDDFHITLTNKTRQEITVTTAIDPPYGEVFPLGTIASGKSISKTYPFLWSYPSNIAIQATNKENIVVYRRTLTRHELMDMNNEVTINEDARWFTQPPGT